MVSPENKLFCRLDGLIASDREQQRVLAMEGIGLLESESIPVFEEATQTVARFLGIPICILGLMDQNQQRFKSAVGLSRLGLMNELATSRQCPRLESFCTHVVDSHHVLAIEDTLLHPAFANSLLAHQYGIRAYLGAPLITSTGFCVGTLAVMDLEPRQFGDRDIEFLELTARWCMSEFERQHHAKGKVIVAPQLNPTPGKDGIGEIKVELLGHLTQELRTPLTSVMGMASVLTREIYGPLTNKQKEYLGIIHNSGQYLLSLVNEIVELADPKINHQDLNLISVDIEMLCKQAINTLEQAAQRRDQQVRLSVEPGRRIWLLDKDKVRQIIYHLAFSVIQTSTAGSIVRLHVSNRKNSLNLAVWVSHPWLGEGLPLAELYIQPALVTATTGNTETVGTNNRHSAEFELYDTSASHLSSLALTADETDKPAKTAAMREPSDLAHRNLGLLLSRRLAELHGGQITIQGSSESGYRYIVSLPQPAESSAE